MINKQKVTDMAAFFLMKAGGRMPHLKLIKLLYLAERRYLARYDASMTGDRTFNLPHGPILSDSLNLIDRDRFVRSSKWDETISPKVDHEVRLLKGVTEGDLDELGLADLQVLEQVWGEFGQMDRWAIVDYCHKLPEYEQPPERGRLPLPVERILRALGKTEEQAREIREGIEERDRIDRVVVAR